MAKNTTADELRSLAEKLIGIADSLDKEKSEAKAEEPAKEISYTDIRKILADKSRAGHTAEIKAILESTEPGNSRRSIRKSTRRS